MVHLIHPKPVPWTVVFESFSNFLHVPLVAYDEWFTQLEDCRRSSVEPEAILMTRIPALKLLDFFREVGSAQRKSEYVGNGNVGINGQPTTSKTLIGKLPGAEGLNMPILAVDNAVAVSPTLADPNLAGLGIDDVRKWLTYWRMIL